MDIFTACQEQKFFRRQDRMLLLYYSKKFRVKGVGRGVLFRKRALNQGSAAIGQKLRECIMPRKELSKHNEIRIIGSD